MTVPMTADAPSPLDNWHVLRTKPGRSSLDRALFYCRQEPRREVFHPLYVASPGQTEPLFPGYLFMRFDAAEPWHAVLNIPGIAWVIRSLNQIPATVPALVMSFLIANPKVFSPDYSEGVKDLKGRPLSIVGGPFAGLSGMCSASGQERVTVLLQVLGGVVPTKISRQFVREIV